jgi:hypothetical protein
MGEVSIFPKNSVHVRLVGDFEARRMSRSCWTELPRAYAGSNQQDEAMADAQASRLRDPAGACATPPSCCGPLWTSSISMRASAMSCSRRFGSLSRHRRNSCRIEHADHFCRTAQALSARTAGRSVGVGTRRAFAGSVTTATVLPVMSKNSNAAAASPAVQRSRKYGWQCTDARRSAPRAPGLGGYSRNHRWTSRCEPLIIFIQPARGATSPNIAWTFTPLGGDSGPV